MAPRRPLLASEKAVIASYLEDGGSALVLSEPNSSSDFSELLRPYGIDIQKDIILEEVLKMFEGASVGLQPVVKTYSSHPAVLGFEQQTIFSTISSVRAKKVEDQQILAEEIAYTNPSAWTSLDLENIFSETHTVDLPKNEDKRQVPIAVASERLEDTLEKNEQADTKKGIGRIIAIGDADFVANVNIRQLFNRDFFLNSMNWVLGDSERVTMRARTMLSLIHI